MGHNDLNLDSLHRNTVIALPQKEHALAWLVANGPLVVSPGLPDTVLRSLMADHRILRLHRDLYLVPTAEGVLPSLPQTVNLVDPDGYISGHGALMLHGLNDQDIARWYSVSPHRQADIAYGDLTAHFVLSPSRLTTASTTQAVMRDKRIRVATPARAFVDEVDLMPFGLNYPETLRILRDALGVGAATERGLVAELRKTPSVASSRRLGFLLEMATGAANEDLRAMAHSIGGLTRLRGDDVPELVWRLYLPATRADIAGASR